MAQSPGSAAAASNAPSRRLRHARRCRCKAPHAAASGSCSCRPPAAALRDAARCRRSWRSGTSPSSLPTCARRRPARPPSAVYSLGRLLPPSLPRMIPSPHVVRCAYVVGSARCRSHVVMIRSRTDRRRDPSVTRVIVVSHLSSSGILVGSMRMER